MASSLQFFNMNRSSKERRRLHALSTLETLNTCRKNNFLCDFTLLVNNKAFRLHRVVLASCSEYFNAMFSHDTKEIREGYCRMPDLETEAMKQCIEFMYTGWASLKVENAQPLLHASCLLHLDGLTDLCFELLMTEIKLDNCLFMKSLGHTYNGNHLEVAADKFVLANFDSVINEYGFLELDVTDLIRYFESPNIRISSVISLWRATIKWITHDEMSRKTHLCELLQHLKMEDYPELFVRVTVWQCPLVQESDACKGEVAQSIFHKVLGDCGKDTTNVQSCLFIKSLGREYSCKEAEKVADKFVLENFDEVVDQRGFRHLEKDDVIYYIRSPEIRYPSEVTLWKAVVTWIRHDLPGRREYFSEMLKFAKLDKMPSEFLQNTVRNDELVKSSDVCKDMLMDALFKQVTREKKSGIAVIDRCSKVLKSYDPSLRQWHDVENVKINFPLIGSFVFTFVIEKFLFVLIKKSLYRIQWKEKNAAWTEMAGMNTKRDIGTSAAAIGRFIYAIDGRSVSVDSVGKKSAKRNSNDKDQLIASCGECYDSLLDSWSYVDMMSVPRSNSCLATCGSYLYLIGGKLLLRKDGNWPGIDTPTNIAECYDPVSQSWTDIAAMEIPRYDSAAAFSNGRIYVMGGFGHQGRLKDVETFDTVTKNWTKVAQMAVSRSYFSACLVEGGIYAIGGDYRKDAYDKTIECFHEHKRKWEIVKKLNMKIFDNAACVISLEE